MNCDLPTLKTLHAYARFIGLVMNPIVKGLEALPPKPERWVDAIDPELTPTPVSKSDLTVGAIKARSAWGHMQHVRHMRTVYGINDDDSDAMDNSGDAGDYC